MDILAFVASPRRNGNSELLLDRIVEGLRDAGATVEKISTHELDLQPCNGCGRCELTGRCGIHDEFQDIYDRIIKSDGIVFATPLYFMNIPSRGKALIDRCQSFWIAKHRLGMDLFEGRHRPGLVAACSGAGSGPGGSFVFRGLMDTMTYFFDALGLTMLESMLVARVEEKADILKHDSVLEEAYIRGRNMADSKR